MIALSKKRPTTPTIVLTAIAAAYLSAAVVLDAHIDYTGDLYTTYPGNFVTPTGFLDVLWWLLLGGALYAGLSYAGRIVATLFHATKKARAASAFARSMVDPDYAEAGSVSPGKTMSMTEVTGELSGRRLTLYVKDHMALLKGIAFVVFACWLLAFLAYYPGTSMNDQIGIIVNPIPSSATHPLLYCLLLSGLVNATQLILGDGSYGFAAYVLLDMAVCATIVSALCLWLRWRGAKPLMVWLVALFFALTPVVANNAICSIKDTLFNFVLLLWIPFFDEFLRRRGKLFAFKEERRNYVILCALTGLTRNNGLIVVVLLIATVIVASTKRHGMKEVLASSLLALAIMAVPSLVPRLLNLQYNSAEALGVPIQQLCAVEASGQGTMTPSQKGILDQAINPDLVPDDYYPIFVDGIKYQGALSNEFVNAHRDEFVRLWIDVGLESPTNLDLYVRAWLSNSYGCWGPEAAPHPWQSYFFKQQSNEVFGSNAWYQDEIAHYHLACRSLLPADFTARFKAVWEPLVASPGTGALFAIVLVLAVLACHKESSVARGLLPYLPLILLWLSLMLSVPLSTALRYGLSLLLGIPILVCLLILPENRTGQSAAVLASDQAESMREEWPF